LLAVLGATAAVAQPADGDKGCNERWGGWGNRGHACGGRETRAKPGGTLSVDGSPNGGISVTGSDRKDVLVRAVVHTWAASADDARAMFKDIVVREDTTIRAQGGSQYGKTGWSVSYEIEAPRNTDLNLDTTNGGIT